MSVDSTGIEGNGDSLEPSISGNGRFIAFRSDASNLVPGDTNSNTDVLVHDRKTGQTFRASVNSAGVEGNAFSFNLAISRTGRFVGFRSGATNLVANDGNGKDDIFVRDTK